MNIYFQYETENFPWCWLFMPNFSLLNATNFCSTEKSMSKCKKSNFIHSTALHFSSMEQGKLIQLFDFIEVNWKKVFSVFPFPFSRWAVLRSVKFEHYISCQFSIHTQSSSYTAFIHFILRTLKLEIDSNETPAYLRQCCSWASPTKIFAFAWINSLLLPLANRHHPPSRGSLLGTSREKVKIVRNVMKAVFFFFKIPTTSATLKGFNICLRGWWGC